MQMILTRQKKLGKMRLRIVLTEHKHNMVRGENNLQDVLVHSMRTEISDHG